MKKIETIYIPTVNRVNDQITFNMLPRILQKKVTFVVQAWERESYKYDANYLILPDTEEYHYTNYFCLSNTKKFIYETAGTTMYCVTDDDLVFHRRNRKYFGMESNLEKSSRKCTEDDIIEMFSEFEFLLSGNIALCGPAFGYFPPSNKKYKENGRLSDCYFIDGSKIYRHLCNIDLTSVKILQDSIFTLSLLTVGCENRISQEFLIQNISYENKKLISDRWDSQTAEQILNEIKIFKNMFPGLVEEIGDIERKNNRFNLNLKVSWSKAYKQFLDSTSRNNLYNYIKSDSEHNNILK